MVGDRCFDVEGAKAFGMDSIGVLFGYGSRDELENAGATYIVETAKELLSI
jgi:phosphoglycolate phosphatase